MQPVPVETVSHSPRVTRDIGRTLGQHARPGHVFLLSGPLGAGKTCLAQGVLWGLGADELARSPTFVLVSQYDARLPMYHIDLYRLDSSQEMLDLGLDEYLYGEGVSVVEWADKAPGLFPDEHLSIRIETLGESERRFTMSANAPSYEEVLNAVRSHADGR